MPIKAIAKGKLGIRQKLGLTRSTAKDTPVRGTPLGKKLVGLYSKGKLSAPDMGYVAGAMVECNRASSSSSGPRLTDKNILRLAKAQPKKVRVNKKGKTVPDTRNANRSIKRTLAVDAILGEPYEAQIDTWDKDKDLPCKVPIAFYPIHEVLESVCPVGDEHKWLEFSDKQQGFKNDLRNWGRRVQVPSDKLDNFVPIAMWGDSAEFVKRDQLYLLTWTALSGFCRHRFWLCAFAKGQLCACGCKARHTFDSVFEVLAWMFRVLLAGVWPRVDHTGSPFPKGSWRAKKAGTPLRLFGGLVAKHGDWAWHKSVLGMRGWRGEGETKAMCWLCKASFHAGSCFDFTANAPWRATAMNNAEFWKQAQVEKQYVSKIWQIPGFAITTVRPDWMHCCCLGICQYFVGCILWQLFVQVGGTMAKWRSACMVLDNIFALCGRDLNMEVSVTNLTVFMIRPSTAKKPKFKAKAFEGRRFLPILRRALEKYFACESDIERQRLNCLAALCSCYDVMADWDVSTSPQQLATFAKRHLLLYIELGRSCDDPLMWGLYPKHHLFLHLAEGAVTNPRLEWNYSEESEIGSAVIHARAVNKKHVAVQLLNRYRGVFVFGY